MELVRRNRWNPYRPINETYPGADGPHTRVYQCLACGKWRPWCDGGTDSEVCDHCWALEEMLMEGVYGVAASERKHWFHACDECCPATMRDANGKPTPDWKPVCFPLETDDDDYT